jgi:hypothetical protein
VQEHLLRKPVEVDEVKLEKLRERGAHAEELLKNPLLLEWFETVEAAYMQAWRTSGMKDLEKRERSWTAVLLLADLRNLLGTWVRDGEGAAERIREVAED